MPGPKPLRLAYIDWVRGLACVLMFQTHCYDAWLTAAAKKSSFFMWSQVLGTLPAPLFLFLAGISFVLITSKLQKRGATKNEIAITTIRRGAEILALGLLFRLQEYVIAFPWAPWTDLLRVDILNTIGVSIMLMGAMSWTSRFAFSRGSDGQQVPAQGWTIAVVAVAVASVISLVSPLIWTTWRPSWMPWPLESYIDGVHNLGTPQSSLFPIFPWTAFAFAGLACGVFLLSDWSREREGVSVVIVGAVGIGLIEAGRWLDRRPQLYPVSDFWHTSPNFFVIRVGILLAILLGSYLWCRWGPGQWGFSPFIQLGHTSLLVYWVHIELVYGRLSILKKRAMGVGGASAGLLVIYVGMVALSVIKTRWKVHLPRISSRAAISSEMRAKPSSQSG